MHPSASTGTSIQVTTLCCWPKTFENILPYVHQAVVVQNIEETVDKARGEKSWPYAKPLNQAINAGSWFVRHAILNGCYRPSGTTKSKNCHRELQDGRLTVKPKPQINLRTVAKTVKAIAKVRRLARRRPLQCNSPTHLHRPAVEHQEVMVLSNLNRQENEDCRRQGTTRTYGGT